MSAPLPVPSVPPGFPPWTAAGTQTVHPIDQTAPEIEAGAARPRHPSSTHSTTRATLGLRVSHRRNLYIGLMVCTNADWVGCPDTRRSTLGYVVFLNNNLIS
jgi:hypothetical protein